jgi:hypothetical protein
MNMLTNDEIQQSESMMAAHLRSAEGNRREKPSVNPGPITGVMDYAASGNVMELAMGHLRESIPGGQRVRTAAAWAAMKEAVRQHELWLRARGYL